MSALALLSARTATQNDARKFPLIERDYRWAIRMGFFTHSEEAWRDFVEGYGAGEDIGRRVACRRRRTAD